GGAPLGASALPVRFVREGRDPLRGVNYSYSNAVQATRPPETAPDFAAGSAAGQRCRPPATAVRGGRLGGGPSRSVRRPGRLATAAVWPASLPYRPFPGPVAYRTGHHCVGPIHRCGGQVSVLFPAMTSELPPPPAPAAPPGAGVDLTSRAALVTGGGSGIGRACATALAAAGATVHVVDRDADAAKAVAADIGGEAHVVDLADPTALDALPAEVDILVNNAGLQHVAPLTEFPPDRFDLIQQVMVTAPFLLMRRSLPHMYARGWGRLINISSVHGIRASAYKSAYVAAKHALEGLSKVAAIEGAPHGVTSNCIN